jgi:hypothetical protein
MLGQSNESTLAKPDISFTFPTRFPNRINPQRSNFFRPFNFILRLYARVLFTESLPALERIADETSELYRRRNVRYRKKNKKSFPFSTTLTVVESQGILSNILDHHNRPSAFHNFAFSVIVPFFVTFQEERVMKIRTIFSSLIQTLPLTEKLISLLRSMKVPERFLDPAVVLAYSLSQVQSIRFYHGRKILNFF